MKTVIKSLHVIFVVLTMQVGLSAFGADGYFPSRIFYERQDLDEFKCSWYTKQLSAMKEPSIYGQSKNKNLMIYRFTWLRTFHNPISIRLVVNIDGTGILFAKKTDGAGGYDPGKLQETIEKPMDKIKISGFLQLIDSEKFWELPSTTEEQGLDGAQWIIEGLCHGKYHLVDRWFPEKGSVRTIGLYLLDASGIKIDSKEIY